MADSRMVTITLFSGEASLHRASELARASGAEAAAGARQEAEEAGEGGKEEEMRKRE